MFCAAKFIPLRSRTRTQAYRERDILATLSHPLVTALLDQFETRKTLILVLELYPALSRRECGEGHALGSQGFEGSPLPVLVSAPGTFLADMVPWTRNVGRAVSTGSSTCLRWAPFMLHVAFPAGKSHLSGCPQP